MISRDSTANSGVQVLASSATFSYTISGIERLLVVTTGSTVSTVTGVTYAGQALTLGISETSGTAKTFFYYMFNPPAGTANVIVTMSSGLGTFYSGSTSFNGVATTSPISVSGAGTSTTPQVTITPTSLNSLLVDCVYTVAAATLTLLSPEVVNFNVTDGVNVLAAASGWRLSGEPAPTTMGATSNVSTGYSVVALSFFPKVPQIMPPTEGAIDPTIPSYHVGYRHIVVGY